MMTSALDYLICLPEYFVLHCARPVIVVSGQTPLALNLERSVTGSQRQSGHLCAMKGNPGVNFSNSHYHFEVP